MPLIQKPNYNQIFASQAPEQDKPAVFNNYPLGWGVESRPNNGKPTIKGFNYLQQTSDLKDLWILQNGACLPYDESIEYADGAPVLKDGVIQYKIANGFKSRDTVTVPTYNNAVDGVDPVTGVPDGAYFNVRSADDNTVAIEYQNVGGSAVAPGKSYLSALGVQSQEKPANTIKDASGKNQQEINDKFLKESISVEDFITNPFSTDHTYAFIALNTYFSNKDNVEFSLGDRDYSINVSTANLLDFRGKDSVIIHAGSAKIKDNSSYTAPQARNIINVDGVKFVQINGVLDVEGNNIAGSPSMGANVIKAANNALLKAVIKSKGNNAALYDNLGTDSKNWELVIFSENDHYPIVCSNVDTLEASIDSVNSYRSFFLMGVKNGTVNAISTGQRGTSLIKAYSHHVKSYNLEVNASFEGGEPTETYVAPVGLEIQSDIPVSLEDIHVNLNISQNPLNPWLGGSFSIVNYKANGELQTAAVGHKIDGLTVSGNIDGGSSTDILKLMRFGNFYSGDTVDNIELKDLNLQGTGNLNINFAAHKRIKLTNVSLPNGKLLLLNKNTKQPVIISDSEINEVAFDSSGYLKFSDSVIKSRANLVDSNFEFVNTAVDGWNINRKRLGADEQLGFYKQGDLSVAFPIFKATGQVRARCRVNYYVVKDISSTTVNYESGYIEFLLYVTPTGTVTIAGKTKTVVSSNGEAVTIDVTGQNDSGFGSVLFSATNYNSTLSALTCDINFNMIPIVGSWYAVSDV